jgi:hypothetical protein
MGKTLSCGMCCATERSEDEKSVQIRGAASRGRSSSRHDYDCSNDLPPPRTLTALLPTLLWVTPYIRSITPL